MTNTQIFERFREAANSRDPAVVEAVIDEVVAPDMVFHAAPGGATGAAAVKAVWRLLLRAFPDIHVEIEDVIAEGDRVVFRNTVTGTHRGEYRGITPTGRSVTYREIFIVRFADGRIAELWGVVDTLGQLQQLGAVPA
jgi:steroid delta-isomerase-like uncharacterized protein